MGKLKRTKKNILLVSRTTYNRRVMERFVNSTAPVLQPAPSTSNCISNSSDTVVQRPISPCVSNPELDSTDVFSEVFDDYNHLFIDSESDSDSEFEENDTEVLKNKLTCWAKESNATLMSITKPIITESSTNTTKNTC